jgi:hypothetical protein
LRLTLADLAEDDAEAVAADEEHEQRHRQSDSQCERFDSTLGLALACFRLRTRACARLGW